MHEKTAHAGIALSTSIAGWLQLGILVRKIIVQKHLTFDPLLQRNLQLILLACAALTLVLMVCSIVFMPHFIGAPFYRLAAIIVTLIFGMGAFLALIFGTGVLKIKELKQSFLGEK
jgi:putative peptidoglycan lipid II flippase